MEMLNLLKNQAAKSELDLGDNNEKLFQTKQAIDEKTKCQLNYESYWQAISGSANGDGEYSLEGSQLLNMINQSFGSFENF